MIGNRANTNRYGWLASGKYGTVIFGAPLRNYSTWRIGGPADALVAPQSVYQISVLRYELTARDIPWIVVGNGSNLLFDDRGIRGVVIHIGRNLAGMEVKNKTVVAEAGIGIPRMVRRSAVLGLGGIEHTVGIRGNLGGLVVMNGGSQRRSISENLVTVQCVGPDGSLQSFTAAECNFGYRRSRFQQENWIITKAALSLSRRSYLEIRRDLLQILRARRSKFPLNQPNCGSVFVSDSVFYNALGPPGRIIELLGCKGMRIGNAQVSFKHANFMVNLGGACAVDALMLIHKVRNRVYAKTNVWLESEVRFVREDTLVLPAHSAVQ